jgi:hypothetical protein
MSRAGNLLARLIGSKSGVAATELALALPFFLGAGLWAVELSNFVLTNMHVSQLAVHLADNASRIGEKPLLKERKIYESDINDLLEGAGLQGGTQMGLFDNGRAIISSVEVVPGSKDDEQYVHWQRCVGSKDWASSYGEEDDKLADGIGPVGEEVYAFEGEAVMFVELVYEYKPLISKRFVGDPTIQAIASFTVRARRDLSEIYQRDKNSPDPIAKCNKFDNPYAA